MRHIHANDFCKGFVLQKLPQKAALAAAKIENTLRAAAAKRCHDGSHALFGQAYRLLNGLFFARVSFRYFVRRGLLLPNEATQCFAGQPLLVFQIAIGNQLAFGMLAKPAFAVA